MENALTSMLWKTKAVRGLLKTGRFVLFRYDMCQYGAQYNKNDTASLLGTLDKMGIVQNL